jgi:hypothetical protein
VTARDELRRLLELAVWSYADAIKAERLVQAIFAEQSLREWRDRVAAEPAQDGDESGW